MPTSFDAKVAIRQVVGDESLADAVLDRMVQPDFLAALWEVAHDLIEDVLWVHRETAREVGGPRLGSREEADVLAAGIADFLVPPAAPPASDAQLADEVARISYKGWDFSLVQLPTGERAVRMVATVDDAHKPGEPFTTSRTVAIRRSVHEAALQAILSLEEHEARERFQVDGKRALSPHVPQPPGPRTAAALGATAGR